MQAEVMTPMKKKQGALQKLKIHDSEDEDESQPNKFEQLEPLLTKVWNVYLEKKKEFEKLQARSHDELVEMHLNGDFETLCKLWQTDLEHGFSEASGVNEETWVEFTTQNKEKYNEIDHFLQIFHDWHHETFGTIKEKAMIQQSNEKQKKKEQSSKELEKAQVQAQALLAAQAKA